MFHKRELELIFRRQAAQGKRKAPWDQADRNAPLVKSTTAQQRLKALQDEYRALLDRHEFACDERYLRE
jgi:Mlc titration factor MtfA (ptsG expression regulator)